MRLTQTEKGKWHMFSPMWTIEFRYVCLICSACRSQGSLKGNWCGEGRKNGRKGGLSVVVSLFACLFEERNQVPDSLTLMETKCLQGYFKVLNTVLHGYFLSPVPVITKLLNGICV